MRRPSIDAFGGRDDWSHGQRDTEVVGIHQAKTHEHEPVHTKEQGNECGGGYALQNHDVAGSVHLLDGNHVLGGDLRWVSMLEPALHTATLLLNDTSCMHEWYSHTI